MDKKREFLGFKFGPYLNKTECPWNGASFWAFEGKAKRSTFGIPLNANVGVINCV